MYFKSAFPAKTKQKKDMVCCHEGLFVRGLQDLYLFAKQKKGAKAPTFALESDVNHTFSPVELTIRSVRGKVYTEDLNSFQRIRVVTVREFEAE